MEVLHAVQGTANLYSDKQCTSLLVLKDVNNFGQLLAEVELLVKCVLNEFSCWNVLGLQIILYALQFQKLLQSVSPLLSAPENLHAEDETLLGLSSNYADHIDGEEDGEESEGDEEDEEEEEGEEEDEGEPESEGDDDEKGNVEDNEEDEEAEEGGDPAEDEDEDGEGEEDEEDNGEAGAEEEDDDDDDEDEVPDDEDEDEDDEDDEEEEAPKPKKIKR